MQWVHPPSTAQQCEQCMTGLPEVSRSAGGVALDITLSISPGCMLLCSCCLLHTCWSKIIAESQVGGCPAWCVLVTAGKGGDCRPCHLLTCTRASTCSGCWVRLQHEVGHRACEAMRRRLPCVVCERTVAIRPQMAVCAVEQSKDVHPLQLQQVVPLWAPSLHVNTCTIMRVVLLLLWAV
jgi:hypothetical protein